MSDHQEAAPKAKHIYEGKQRSRLRQKLHTLKEKLTPHHSDDLGEDYNDEAYFYRSSETSGIPSSPLSPSLTQSNVGGSINNTTVPQNQQQQQQQQQTFYSGTAQQQQ
jgi:hypothetical protein